MPEDGAAGVAPANERYPFRYPTEAQAQPHPDNLYATAWLRGFAPVPVESARVLELGCGNGHNLIPMACDFPAGSFTGIDYAAGAIDAAQAFASKLRLLNTRLLAADLRLHAGALGEFDYIPCARCLGCLALDSGSRRPAARAHCRSAPCSLEGH